MRWEQEAQRQNREAPRTRFKGEGDRAMVWTARPDMSCEYLSREWLAFTGYSAEQALGDGWPHGLHPEDLARWLDTCVRSFDAREPFQIEYRLRRRDGAYRWVLERGVPRYSPDGVFAGFAGTCVDVDERKRAEGDLARALERARKLRIANEEAMLHGVRVLVVGDDPVVREAMLKVLGIAGAQTKSACSSAEALDALRDFRPDVLLSDVGMRGGDGYDLIRAVRALPPERGGCLRAAALTPPNHPEDGLCAVAAGYDAQLAKPVEPMALLATVARLAQPAGL
jgi:PAS domain S-box-containing protein